MDEERRELVPLDGGVTAVRSPEEVAQQIILVLDRIAEHMGLETPHPSTAKQVRGGRTVPRQFVVGMAAAVEAMPDLQMLRTFDPGEARAVLESGDAYREVAERVAELLASLNYTIDLRWSKVASAALLTFSLAKVKAKKPGKAKLAARLKRLSKLLGRKGSKKK